MKTIGVIANGGKEKAKAVLGRLRVKAEALGLRLLPEPETAVLLGMTAVGTARDILRSAELVLVMGGDGTMLRAVRALDGRDVPVIGVNLGALGFMTSVTEDKLEYALDCLVAGGYSTSLRTIIDCQVIRKGDVISSYRALNDVVMTSVGGRVATLRMTLSGEAVGDFVCDGLIISTPTGSTGHSLSTGGPILMPSVRTLVASLICPHTLSTRPLVIPDDVVVAVEVVERSLGAKLAVDGQIGQELEVGDRVEIKRSGQGVRLIHLPGYSYFSVLRQKLHWRGSNV
jgi:NAD+ kinase